MQVALIANTEQREAMLTDAAASGYAVHWCSTPNDIPAECTVIDLQFDGSPERIARLSSASSSCCIVHSVQFTCAELPSDFVRINAWPGFGKHGVVEAACVDKAMQPVAITALAAIGLKPEWVADIPGFLSARVVAMIINEAFYTLEEEVSTREAVDTAMKLGTNYPYGPFEWCSMIGAANVYALLELLSASEKRYTPAAWLKKEVTRT